MGTVSPFTFDVIEANSVFVCLKMPLIFLVGYPSEINFPSALLPGSTYQNNKFIRLL